MIFCINVVFDLRSFIVLSSDLILISWISQQVFSKYMTVVFESLPSLAMPIGAGGTIGFIAVIIIIIELSR